MRSRERLRDLRPGMAGGAGIPADIVDFLERERRETRAAFPRWAAAAKLREARIRELEERIAVESE